MAVRDADEHVGDVALAMQLVLDLGTDSDPAGPADPAGRVQAAVDQADPGELVQGLGTVLTACMGLLDDPGEAIMPVLAQLRARELIPGHLLPTMGAVLTAAAMRQPPVQWRTGLAHIPAAEIPAWTYTTWLLAGWAERSLGQGTVSGLAHCLGV